MIREYVIQEKIGTGCYGVVYKAYKLYEPTIYVLKQIPLIGLTQEQIYQVLTEAKILSLIKSNYVVKYYDSFLFNRSLNIVMEYCDNGDLCKYICECKKTGIPLPEELIWKIFIQIAIGLSSIHKINILHRDLKTLNIFLKKGMEIRIGDLGVAKELDQLKLANSIIGTPYYLSPEMCEEKPYNEKSDVWALGCILYELCTYEHPFNASNQGALFIKIIKENPKPILNCYSKDLQYLINCILEKNTNIRPTCKEILGMPSVISWAKKFNLYKDIITECYEFEYYDPSNLYQKILNESVKTVQEKNFKLKTAEDEIKKKPVIVNKIKANVQVRRLNPVEQKLIRERKVNKNNIINNNNNNTYNTNYQNENINNYSNNYNTSQTSNMNNETKKTAFPSDTIKNIVVRELDPSIAHNRKKTTERIRSEFSLGDTRISYNNNMKTYDAKKLQNNDKSQKKSPGDSTKENTDYNSNSSRNTHTRFLNSISHLKQNDSGNDLTSDRVKNSPNLVLEKQNQLYINSIESNNNNPFIKNDDTNKNIVKKSLSNSNSLPQIYTPIKNEKINNFSNTDKDIKKKKQINNLDITHPKKNSFRGSMKNTLNYKSINSKTIPRKKSGSKKRKISHIKVKNLDNSKNSSKSFGIDNKDQNQKSENKDDKVNENEQDKLDNIIHEKMELEKNTKLIRFDIFSLLGEPDYTNIMEILNKLDNSNIKIDEINDLIDKFDNGRFDKTKKEKLIELSLKLISTNNQIEKKLNEIKNWKYFL